MMLANDSQYWVGSGWVQIFFTYSGLGWVSQLMGWVGSHKLDPWTTLSLPLVRSSKLYRTHSRVR